MKDLLKKYVALSAMIGLSLLGLLSCVQSPSVPISTDVKSWKDPKIINQLKTGKIVSDMHMKDFLNSKGKKAEFEGKVYWVQLDNGLQAVFKCLDEDEMDDAYAEVAAYYASVELGFPYIPPTVIRSIEGIKGTSGIQQGSLQLFVDTSIDALKEDVFKKALQEADPEEVANLKVFYFVLGQWDTGAHNILILEGSEKGKKHLIAIDNSGIKQRQHVKEYGELPFVRTNYSEKLDTNDWDQPFPFDQAKTIKNPSPENLKQEFGNSFPDAFYQSFKSYQEPLTYVIYQDSLWRQFHANDPEFVRSYTNNISEKTRIALEKLNKELLEKIFEKTGKPKFMNKSYLEAILERRDQILNHIKESAKLVK